jgi:transcriptional regulator with XRE-family HTH domain
VTTKALARRVDLVHGAIGEDIRAQRLDAGISQRLLAAAAGVDQSYLGKIEAGSLSPSIATLTAISLALGSDLSVRLYPNTGPPIRDASQALMSEALLKLVHRRWRRFVEVQVRRPSRGVIDLVLHEPAQLAVVALEVQSQMRRLEQQIRWGRAKAEALPSSDIAQSLWPNTPSTPVSSALLLRSTRTNRDLATQFEGVFRAAYPASTSAAIASLTTAESEWPGSVVLWAEIDNGTARILDRPPRGVRLGT